ncbi:nitrogen fixation protein NifQ [Paraburkholderia dilworthii]|uniref:nitrogen fixation protein NifQ n=1 Tax=Paraburkholderia dilworthii TaxID=948106 RepID=UPI00055B2F74|nr:nitrogen fixation protein NifQ [Paraburkholderia dilworthii]
MACAVDAGDPTVLALAGVLSSGFEHRGVDVLPMRGLDPDQTHGMLARWFPGAGPALGLKCALSPATMPREDELEDLVALLNHHADPRAGPADEANCVAHALACASLGQNHLWQDLLLPSRRELSALIDHWFPRLAAKNTHDMKWKKFFYKQLCEREGLSNCKAPSCGVCSDHVLCFGAE